MGQPQRIFDSLAYVNELKEVGVSEKQATVHAETLFAILDNQLLTKQDMHDMEMRLSNDIKQLDFNMKDVELKLSKEIQQLDSKVAGVECRLSQDIQQLDSKLIGVESKLSQDIQQLDSKLIGVESKLSQDIQQLDSKVAAVEVNLNAKIVAVESKLSHEMKVTKYEVVITLGGLMVVLVTLLGAFMKMFIGVIH